MHWQSMPKVKRKSDKQRQRQDKVRKKDERAAPPTEASDVESIGTSTSQVNSNTAKNSGDGKSATSNSGKLLSRNSTVGNSTIENVPSAQAIVEKYLQSQKDLARRHRCKKRYVDTDDSVQKADNEMFDRSSVQFKHKEKRQQYTVEWRRRARSQPEFREYERQHTRASMKMAREEAGYKERERESNRKSMQMIRKNPAYRDSERESQMNSKQIARENPEYRQNEQQCDTNRRKMVRKDSANRIREQMHDTERRKSLRSKHVSLDDLIKNFHQEVGKGPVHKCCVCDQLWYRHGVVIVQKNSLPDCNAVDVCLPDIRRSEGNQLICKTCLSHLRKRKIPPSSTANGMGFPEIPQHLKDLHQVEWRLVSPRIPFMKVFAAPRGGQKKIRGNVVNVPCDTVNTFQVLPHSGSEHQTIQVKIKRDLRYANHVMSQNVRPYKVREAAEYLVTHGKLFKEQGISFDKPGLKMTS